MNLGFPRALVFLGGNLVGETPTYFFRGSFPFPNSNIVGPIDSAGVAAGAVEA